MRYRSSFYLSMVVCGLVLNGCGDKKEIENKKPEGAVCTGNECSEGMLCIENFCRKLCQVHNECAKHQICDPTKHICMDSAGYQCSADEDCKTPGQCEVMRDAVCEGGRCIYQPQEAGVPCDDERICTVNDKCDGDRKCVGTTFECITPPAAECVGNDNIYRTYHSIGHCEVNDGAPSCVYTYEDKECANCQVNCNHYCDDVDCSQHDQNGLCVEHVCQYQEGVTDPCVLHNKYDGTACKYQDALSTKILDGYCAAGDCVECIDDSQCVNNSAYPECLDVKCLGNKCTYTPKANQGCGDIGVCYRAVLYKSSGSCAPDGLSCDAQKKDCAPYQCNAGKDGCLELCKTDGDCVDGYFCNNDYTCQAKSKDGEFCNYDYHGRDCVTGYCDILNDDETKAVCCASGNCCIENGSNCLEGQKCQLSTHQCISGEKDSPCLEYSDCKEGLYCNDLTKLCTVKLVTGATLCKKDEECQTGYCDVSTTGPETGRCCASGECCDTKDDCPANHVCKNSQCTLDDSGTPCVNDSDCNRLASYCAPNNDGNMVCTPKKDNGKNCDDPRQCAAGFCVEGICCDSACEDANMSCNSDSYGKTKGQCRKIIGETCQAGTECQSDYCVDGYCCTNKCSAELTCSNTPGGQSELSHWVCNAPNSEGTCAQKASSCGLYQCKIDGSGCWDSCDGSAGRCISGAYCDNTGHCQLKRTQAQPCGKVYSGSPGQSCETNICADGYCCNTGCDGLCQSCAVAGMEGQCSNVVNGEDDTCKGICSMGSSGLICKALDGTKCNFDYECKSDHCVDGVCCNSTCDKACESCNQTGKLGTCTFTPREEDPLCNSGSACGSRSSSGNCVCYSSETYILGEQRCGLRSGYNCSWDFECVGNWCISNHCN